MDILAWFHTIGSIIAVLTGAFTVYDRFFRYQPLISIAVKLEGANANPYLRVKNIAPFDIFIEGINVDPPAFGISPNSRVRGVAETVVGKKTTVSLEPGQALLFDLVLFDLEKRNIREDQTIRITAPWRRSVSRLLRPKASTLTTSIRDIEERKRAVLRAGPRAS